MSLTIEVTAGKTLARNERANNAKLNALGLPTLALSGTASTAQIGDDQVTAAKAAFGAWFYCTASGTNTITLTATGHSITLTEGMIARFKVAADNTGAVDITFGGSTKDLFRYYNSTTAAGVELAAGDLRAGQQVEIIYDGTRWQLLSALAIGPVIVGTDAGSTDAYAITPSPSVRAYADITGIPVVFKANTINTGAATLEVSGLGSAKSIVKSYNVALSDGDIKAGQWVTVVYDGTNFQLQSPVTQASTRATVPVRQTVLTGPVDSNGHAQLLSYSGQNITLAATSGSPLVVAFAAGHDASGAVDYVNRLTSSVSNAWTLPTVDATYYLFTDRDAATGAITYGYTTGRPSYVDDNAASITSGAHTFLINEMQMYLGDGAAAATKQRVFIGESVVSGNVITSVTSYMFQGRFQSSADQTISANNTNQVWTETHKLGLLPRQWNWMLVCQTSDLGYAQGDEVPVECIIHTSGSPYAYGRYASATTLAYRVIWGTIGMTASLVNRGAYTYATGITPGNWKLRAYAARGW